MSKYDQLFGKALQTLVTRTLLNQNTNGVDQLTVLELSRQILADKPSLQIYVNTSQDLKKFRRRIFNCVKQLNQADLIKLEKINADKVGVQYYIIYTKIN